MNFVELLCKIIEILFIGFSALIVAVGVIGKIGEESRKNTDHAEQSLHRLFKEIPDMVVDTAKTVINMQEEQEKKQHDRRMEEFENEMNR
jgi:hypothetical protein